MLSAVFPPVAEPVPFGAEDASDAARQANTKAACTNCRQSHVACSHEIPCARCKNLGLDDSCRYLPRKRRTDFKKRKQEIEKKKKKKVAPEESVVAPAQTTLGDDSEGLLNATLAQLFGEEYPFPLVDSNQPVPQETSWIGQMDVPSYQDEDVNENGDWISKLSKAIGDAKATSSKDGNDATWPPSPSFTEEANLKDMQLFSPAEQQMLPNSAGLELSPTLTVARRFTEDRLSASTQRTSSKTLKLLHELKQKNDRLEQLLRQSLQDIQKLKERETMYQQQVQNFMREEQRSFQLFSLGPARDFDHQPGLMPGIAMFSLLPARRHQMLQCNQAFQKLIGRSWQELSQGFTCCQMFPKRILPLLRQRFADICNKDGPSAAEGELIILRPTGEEVAIKAYSHVIFDDAGEPLYKMFYAFALQ